MSGTVWIHQSRPRTPWYELNAAEQQTLRRSWDEVDARQSDARSLGRYAVRGQSDYSVLEVWEFACPDDAFTFWEARVRADYAVWHTSSNLLGVPSVEAEKAAGQ